MIQLLREFVKNKTVIVVGFLVTFFFFCAFVFSKQASNRQEYLTVSAPSADGIYADNTRMEYGSLPPSYIGDSVDLEPTQRMTVTSSSLSILVKDIAQTTAQIEEQALRVGGFTVRASLHTPTEGGSGSIAIRVPVEKVKETQLFLREIGVKVISENIMGNDVTDAYVDTEARLSTLQKTKQTFEGMLERATTVDEILKVQKAIIQTQNDIDAIKGQMEYLKKTSQSSLITISLSTDELSLPYSPADTWRPQVVFKLAVRSLNQTFRSVATLFIWSIVYLPVLIIVGMIWILFSRVIRKKA